MPAVGEGPARLVDFLAGAGDVLSATDRRRLVEQAMVLLGETYVHLELKRAMHAVEPIQRLRLLRYRLSQDAGHLSDLAFHAEMTAIFSSLRDLHTNYLLPSPYRQRTAFLPFLVEECFEGGRPRYLVTKVAEGVEHPTFAPGVEVLHWNGMPIDRAVAVEADRHAGGNPAARHARGLEALTIRPLVRSLPPEEHWVVVSYRDRDGAEREERWDWMVWAPPPGGGVDPDASADAAVATALGYDLLTDAVNQARKVLFAPEFSRIEQAAGAVTTEPVAVGDELATTMPTVLKARAVGTGHGRFGHIRIFTFNVADADTFVAEFARLAGQLPPDGLIVDVRGNGGGLIHAAERLLQVLTPRVITPSRAQFVTTPLMLDLCERHAPSPLDATFDLSPWVRSLRQAVATGAVYSQAQPITDAASANAMGQTYQGPVVLVTDALCYSATDMLAAGFRDHAVGPILGVDDNTGAGGANVWTHELLRLLADVPRPGAAGAARNPFRPLPHGAGMRVSVRRTTRVGERDGTPLEDLGVVPDERHRMTRRDLLEGNPDLLDHAGRLLAAAPVHRLDFAVEALPPGELEVKVNVHGVDRVDAWVDGRPAASFDLDGDAATRRLRSPVAAPGEIELRGYLAGRPVARARRPVV